MHQSHAARGSSCGAGGMGPAKTRRPASRSRMWIGYRSVAGRRSDASSVRISSPTRRPPGGALGCRNVRVTPSLHPAGPNVKPLASGPAHPPALAAALPAQQLLLEAHRLRPAVQHRRPHREAQRPSAPRARHPRRRAAVFPFPFLSFHRLGCVMCVALCRQKHGGREAGGLRA